SLTRAPMSCIRRTCRTRPTFATTARCAELETTSANAAIVSSRSMNITHRTWPGACAAAALAFATCVAHEAHAQSDPRPPRFEVDPTWPKVPNDWVLGEVTSVSVDRNDNVWVLHVPQSIPEDRRENAAPPVLQFDSEGNLLRSWGGPDDGAPWLGREHGIFVDADDFVWLGGRAGWPRTVTPGVSDDMIMKFTMDGELVLQIGESGRSTGNLDTENVHQATDVFVDTEDRKSVV